ncbi:hypothetical protein CNMCM5793_002531 [Aspergillus hiratsukae]|uniref:Transcription factor domain-containing protein n=1 Tax=Aspergillus hiratsukae TaxID=1194566 RepID=A0A8H6PD20_9EURO|nr:hypothetical protein CNMCM5793_002531 [Aspergillus hiratsukae]
MTRRESLTVRTPSANSNDLGAISGTSDTTHAAPSTFPDYESHHRSSIDGSGSARTLPSGQSSAVSPVPSAEDSSPLRVPLTAKPPVPSYCLFSLGLSPVGATPDRYGCPISGSSASVELSQPTVSVDVEQVSPNTTSYHTIPPPSRTLTEEIDCKVFAFYVERAGTWIDIGSPEGYFHSYVPQLALREPLLLAACLSCASHLMYLRGMVDKEVEQYYNDRVVSLMIPALSSDQANSSNEALLATVVILRMSEQFLELNSDAQRHLQGAASLFLDGTDWSPMESNLATSCFWTYLRESIRISFLREQPCPFDLGHLSLRDDDMTIPAATDEVWTNRMTFLIIRVASLCWGPPRQHAAAEARSLRDLLEKWKAHLPPSFRPWCICENDNDPFPNIRYFASWHVLAWQFYYAAKVMLAVYYPDDWADKSLHDMHRYIEPQYQMAKSGRVHALGGIVGKIQETLVGLLRGLAGILKLRFC